MSDFITMTDEQFYNIACQFSEEEFNKNPQISSKALSEIVTERLHSYVGYEFCRVSVSIDKTENKIAGSRSRRYPYRNLANYHNKAMNASDRKLGKTTISKPYSLRNRSLAEIIQMEISFMSDKLATQQSESKIPRQEPYTW